MCGLLCMYNQNEDLSNQITTFNKMLSLIKHRGPDDYKIINDHHVLLGHCRLSIIDINGGKQPLEYVYNNIKYSIVYNGEIYNMNTIKEQLINEGFHFSTQSDTEVIVVSFIAYGSRCLNLFDGIFSFVISYQNKLFVARDHLGVKPLYYYHKNDLFIFSSEIKCILMYLQRCIVDKTGIKELLGLGPSISPGRTLYKDIYSLRPGHYMNVYNNFKEINRYWHLKRLKHTRNYEETVYDIRSLVNHSIKQQLLSDVPVSCMLSGGLDSSIITAVASQYVSKLSTYSIDYQDQDKYFQPYEYQTTRDEHYINEMLDRYSTNHKTVTVSQKQLVMTLKDSLIARDAPGMADIDSSFLLVSKEISQHHKVVLSGECADEIFGGYPWFYRQDLINVKGFPWMREFNKRMELFNDDVKALNIENYVLDKYYQTLDEIDYHDQNFENEHKRKMIYLNIEWFMQTLLTRSDSQTMQSSIELRVPFANKDIISYLYNVPWKYMYHDNMEKGLLRDAFKDFLPNDIYNRKKNPYPKTHSPLYCDLIVELLKESLKDKDNILLKLFNHNKLLDLINSKGTSFKYPWFGQLMMGPQLLAYFYQIYLWGRIYHIELE